MIKKLIYTLINIIAFAMTVKAQAIPSYVPTNGLVGWWPFNGNANDESGNGNHGIIHTGTSLSIDRKNNINSSYEIDGVNCFTMRGIELPAELNQNTDYTINIWFKSNDPNKTNQTIFNTFPHNVLDVSIFSTWPPINNTMCTWIGNGAYPWLIGGENCYWSFNNFTNWHHLVVVKSSTKVDYYIDNILRKTQSAPTNFLSNQLFHFIIGGININADNSSLCYASFKGSLDDIAIYNRALNLSEINALYNGSTYTITASSGINGSITPSGITTLNSTANQRYTFTANSGYTVDSVIVDGNKVDSISGYTFSALTSNHTIRVTYKALNIPSYVPTNGLVGWWPFNGNANDESGNGNNGIILGGASLSVDRFSKINSSFAMDGIDGSNKGIKIPVNLNGIEYTTSLWFRLIDTIKLGGNSAQTLICAEPFGVMACGFNHPYFPGNMGSCIGDSYNWNICSGGMTNTWQLHNKLNWHLLNIIKTNTEFNYYIDGNLTRTQSIGLSNSVPITEFYLGAIRISSGEVFKGKLDDIAIYNRALTQTEITQLYTNCVATTSTTNLTIPSTSLPYTWNGLTFNAAGSQTKHLINAGGCDSAATLNLTVINTALPSYLPANGLVGWWPFNGNANDESGNGNHGTVNGATLTSDRNGVAGKAYSFDGINDFISCTPNLPINSAPRSVVSWFKTNTNYISTSDYPNIQCINAWGSSTSGTVIFPQHIIAPSGKAWFETGSSSNSIYSNNSVNNFQWHQIVTTYNGAGSSIKMYIDGNLQDSTVNLTINTHNSVFLIGNSPWANIPFRGLIDDVAIYNRALTQTEITALYIGNPPCTTTSSNFNLTIPSTSLPFTWNGLTFTNSGSQTAHFTNASGCDSSATLNLTVNFNIPSYIPKNGLIGWWPFNGNANDESGNGNHGILLNGVTLSTDRLLNLNSSFAIDGIDGSNKGIKIPVNLIGTEYTTSIWFMISDSTKGGGNSSQTIICAEPFGVMGCGFNHPYFPNNMGSCIGDSYNWNICSGGMTNTWQLQNKLNWHLLNITKTNTEFKYYIDGNLTRTQSIGPSNSVPITEFYLGTIRISSGEVFKGKLDDIAIYNRALTQTEITQLYTNCVATTSTTNLTIPSTSLPYTWNGLTFNAAGSQTKHLTNVGGCDSAATLNLTVINTALPSYLPANGLVGWWPFNGNANDESGNGNHGTVNGATLTTDRNGIAGRAYSFNGNETIIGNCSTFPSSNSPISISIWYFSNNLLDSAMQFWGIGGRYCGESFISNFNNYDVPKGNYEIQGHCLNFRSYVSSPFPINNYWHQITVTFDGSTFKFYNDGILIKSTSGTLSTFVNGRIFCFGKEVYTDGLTPYSDPVWPGFKGVLDDIAIYNRALTQQEITALYQNTIKLNLTTFLEGSYTGSSSMTATPNKINAAISNSIADSIIVELHESTSPYATMYSSNGVLNTNGTASIAFPNSAIGNSYYIAIKHRNAIETWSAAPVAISNHTIYNFTTAASQAYGDNLSNMGNGVFGIYSGDINQDGSIDFADYPSLDIASQNGVLGYDSNDLNGDASVDFADYPILDVNSNNGIFSIRP